MAELRITIPDALAARVILGMSNQHKYKLRISDPEDPTLEIDNPETRVQFSQRILRTFILNSVKAWEANAAADVARKDALTKVDSEITLT